MDNFLDSLYRGICDLKRSFRFLKYYKPHSEILLIGPLGCPKEFEIVHHHLLLMFSKYFKEVVNLISKYCLEGFLGCYVLQLFLLAYFFPCFVLTFLPFQIMCSMRKFKVISV